MSDIRADLLRLIDLNRQERWVPADQALDQLAGHGEALIPSLVAALEDDAAEVRLLGVELLGAAATRAEAAVPGLVKKRRSRPPGTSGGVVCPGPVRVEGSGWSAAPEAVAR